MNETVPNFDKCYVLDTNIILGDARQVLSIGESGKNLIVLPETVIDEIDSKKSGHGEINFQAREFGRILEDAEVVSTSIESSATRVRISVKGISVDIISFEYYNIGEAERSVANDRRIIEVARFASEFYDFPVILLSNDIMCRTRAISMGVTTEGMSKSGYNGSAEFVKTIEGIDPSELPRMENRHISNYDPDYLPENHCYRVKLTDGDEKLVYLVGGLVNFVDEAEHRRNAVKPVNSGQLFAMSGMMDERIDLCLVNAIAGSGKTLLAIAAGMKHVRKGNYEKIVYIRNSVESTDKAEEIGFLPGMEEKFRIYNYPLYDTLEFIAQKEINGQKGKQTQEAIDAHVEKLLNKYKIETMWNGAIRGRTISNAFVIIDEVQNFGKTSLQTVLSRLDKGSKVVCIGSNRQIDHPYINKHTNGLSSLLKAATEENDEINVFGTELTKVVRGRITEFAERIFENK